MNIIYLTGDHTWGGSSQYFLDIAEAMRHFGHNVRVVTSSEKRSIQRFATKLGDANVAKISTFRPLAMIQLSGILKKAGPVIIHTGNINDASLAIRAKEMSGNNEVHPVVTLHSGTRLSNSNLEQEILEKAEAIISVDEKALSPNINKSVRILPYSVPESNSTKRIDSQQQKTIVFHGRIIPEKHLEYLFDTASKLSDIDFRIRIIGEGNARNVMPLKQSTRRLNIENRVDWLGYIDDAKELIAGCSAGVYPDEESSAYAIRECISQGVPVITGKVDTIEEMLRHTLLNPEYAENLKRENQALLPLKFSVFINCLTSIYSGLL